MRGFCFATSVAVALIVSVSANADPTPPDARPLGNAVAANGGTELQTNTGNAVQSVCGALIAAGGNPLGEEPASSPAEDLLFRCNEMVHNANAVLGSGGTANTLGLSGAELSRAMQQLAGEESLSKGRLATESSNGQFANIGLRLDAIQRGARATTGGLSLSAAGTPIITNGLSGGAAGEGETGVGWGWFANAALGFGERDATANEDEYEYDAYGVTLGVDYLFDTGLVLGAAVGFADFEIEFDDLSAGLVSTAAGGEIELDGYSLSLYGLYDVGGYTIDAVLIAGNNDFDTERRIVYTAGTGATGRGAGLAVDRLIIGSTESSQVAAGIGIGHDFSWDATSLYVHAAVNYLSVDIDGYAERDMATNGGLALIYGDQEVDSLQSSVSAELRRAISTRTGVIIPYVKVDWRHEYDNEDQFLVTRYASAPTTGSNFNLIARSDEPDDDFVDVGVGLIALLAGNVHIFFDYSFSAGLKDTDANLFSLGIRGRF